MGIKAGKCWSCVRACAMSKETGSALEFYKIKTSRWSFFCAGSKHASQKDDACTRVQYVLSQRRVFYFYFFFFFFVIANFQDARLRFTFENITRAKPVFYILHIHENTNSKYELFTKRD